MQVKRKRATEKEFCEWFVVLASLLVGGVFLAVLHLCGVQVCLFKKYTGYPCLTCGSTRAAFFLVRLKLLQAFAIQPLTSLVMICAAASLTFNSILLLFRREKLTLSLSMIEKRLGLLLLLLLALLNWIYLVSR